MVVEMSPFGLVLVESDGVLVVSDGMEVVRLSESIWVTLGLPCGLF